MVFLKYKDGKIVLVRDKRVRVSLNYLGNLIENNIEFKIIEAATNKDIKNDIVNKIKKKIERSNKVKPEKVNEEEEIQVATPNMNRCNQCDRLTVNRFKCSNCWDKVDSNYEGDFLYYG